MNNDQWSPIETAPKDGTEILIFGEGEFAVAAWNGSEWRDIGDIGWGGMDGASPTHWKPLVPPNVVVQGAEAALSPKAPHDRRVGRRHPLSAPDDKRKERP